MRRDPIFGCDTPLLFAHRGGRLEVPESTERAFRHARSVARADVLEIDVQRTADGTLVVWHGPSLENVRIGGFPDEFRRRNIRQNDVTKLDWSVLDGNAWVSDPKPAYEDVSDVPEDCDRRMLRLEEFLQLFPNDAINIEIKTENFDPPHVEALLDRIYAERGDRPILVVSKSRKLLKAYRELAGTKYPAQSYPTGLSASEVLTARLEASLPGLDARPMKNRALQTTHHRVLTPEKLIRRVRERDGAVHVFITGFCVLPALDDEVGHPTAEELFALLKRGVDGVITDRPAQVRPLIDEWKRIHTPS